MPLGHYNCAFMAKQYIELFGYSRGCKKREIVAFLKFSFDMKISSTCQGKHWISGDLLDRVDQPIGPVPSLLGHPLPRVSSYSPFPRYRLNLSDHNFREVCKKSLENKIFCQTHFWWKRERADHLQFGFTGQQSGSIKVSFPYSSYYFSYSFPPLILLLVYVMYHQQ